MFSLKVMSSLSWEMILCMSDLSNLNKENLIYNDDPLGTIAFMSLIDFLCVTPFRVQIF